MLLFVLGILDIVVGGAIWWASGGGLGGATILIFLGVVWFLKGLWSILSAASAGFFFDVLGVFDLIAGIFLMLGYLGLGFGFFIYMAILMILKGLYSFVMGIKT